MPIERALSDQAAAALVRALAEPSNGERWLLLEEALRLHRLAVAEQLRHLNGSANPPSALLDEEPAPYSPNI